MAGVAPNGNIWLLRGVPIDAAHTKTYRPKSASDQFTAFSAYTKYTLTEQTYIRHSINSIRVEYSADDVIDCNYMIFQNSTFSGKYFYAFITDVEYVSNNTCRIVFDVDNLQTYYFDIAFLPSIIDREHSKTDNIGDSTTADFYIGKDIVYNDYGYIVPDGLLFDRLVLMLVTTKDFVTPTKPAAQIYYRYVRPYGYVSQCDITIFDTTSATSDITDISNMITNYISNNGAGVNGVVDMLCVPLWLFTNITWDTAKPYVAYHATTPPISKKVYIPSVTTSSALDGYTPSNKKLYTFPYCYLQLFSPSGTAITLSYEKWEKEANVRVACALEGHATAGIPNIRLVPIDYKNNDYCKEMSIDIHSFLSPQINTDGFTNWLSSNRPSAIADTINGIVSAIQKPTNIISGLQDTLSTVGNAATMAQQQVSVSQATDNISAWAYDTAYFYHARMTIDAESAKIVDDYFTKYGYASGELKTPNFWNGNGRTRFNYCKTQEANIKSKSVATGVPMAALSDIVNIFNSGICLWETISDVGNYGENPVRE